MKVHEQFAKKLLSTGKKVDSWFGCRYSLNLYRGCSHNCAYCDGRWERYFVEGNFGEEIIVKVNAPELLHQELALRPRKRPRVPGWVVFGGGVADSYQPLEEEYQLSRRCLQVLNQYQMPVHMLTKSTLILRDRDWIQSMSEQGKIIVSFSFSSCDAGLSAIVEPGLPSPSERLEAMASLRKSGIHCGALLMPIIPLLSDTPEMLERSVRSVKEAGAEYLLFSTMTLKPGRQKNHFLGIIQSRHPELLPEYHRIYPNNPWGNTAPVYTQSLTQKLLPIARKYQIPVRIPLSFFSPAISEWDQIIILLEQMDSLKRLNGISSHLTRDIRQMEPCKIPLAFALSDPNFTDKFDEKALQTVKEYMDSGRCLEYEQMLHWTFPQESRIFPSWRFT